MLAAPRRIEEAEVIRGDHIQNAIELMRDRYDWIVLDVSRSWSEPSIRALDLADQILVIVELDVPTESKQFLQLISGDLSVNGQTVTAGDGVMLTEIERLEIEAETEAEFLVFDMR